MRAWRVLLVLIGVALVASRGVPQLPRDFELPASRARLPTRILYVHGNAEDVGAYAKGLASKASLVVRDSGCTQAVPCPKAADVRPARCVEEFSCPPDAVSRLLVHGSDAVCLVPETIVESRAVSKPLADGWDSLKRNSGCAVAVIASMGCGTQPSVAAPEGAEWLHNFDLAGWVDLCVGPATVSSASEDWRAGLLERAQECAQFEEEAARSEEPYDEGALLSGFIGQEHVSHSLSQHIINAKSGWGESDRPLVMVFLGPSGVGKTMMAKRYATARFGKSLSELKREVSAGRCGGLLTAAGPVHDSADGQLPGPKHC